MNGTGNVAASLVLVRTSINDANRRIGRATGEPIGLGQQLRMRVAALTNGNGHAFAPIGSVVMKRRHQQ